MLCKVVLWKLSEAFYADAVRRVNLLTLAFMLYAFASIILTQPFFGPFYDRIGLVVRQRFTQVTPTLRKCKLTQVTRERVEYCFESTVLEGRTH